jgi:hypothetical protein
MPIRVLCLGVLVVLVGCGGKSSLADRPCAASSESGGEACVSLPPGDAGAPLVTDASGQAGDSSASSLDSSASSLDSSAAGLDASSPPLADAGPVVVATTAPCIAAHENIIYLDGDPDDPVHPGQATYTFPVTSEGCGAYMSTPAELSMGCPASFGTDTAEIGFFFRTADGRPLELGVYEHALSTDRLPGYPFLQVRAQGAYGGACGDYSIGRFQIEQLDLDSRGQAKEVLISFEQQCTLHLGVLRGCVRYTEGGL